jgi:hypothetical protein
VLEVLGKARHLSLMLVSASRQQNAVQFRARRDDLQGATRSRRMWLTVRRLGAEAREVR